MKNDESVTRIPDFRSPEEEAAFWDTHDVTDYLDELRPVQVRPSPRPSSASSMRLDPEHEPEVGSQESKENGKLVPSDGHQPEADSR